MKYIKKFNEGSNSLETVIIDGESYEIKRAHFDLSKFDDDGTSSSYPRKSYVVIEPVDDPRVRTFIGIYDDNNHRGTFDPLNYSDEIKVWLDHGDECYIEDLYEILSTTNKSGRVGYDYLAYPKDEITYIVHDDLKRLSK